MTDIANRCWTTINPCHFWGLYLPNYFSEISLGTVKNTIFTYDPHLNQPLFIDTQAFDIFESLD